MDSDFDLKSCALTYAQKFHFAVFPLLERGKEPATTNGFYDATTDLQQIKKWWYKNPNFNIGIATGQMSGGLIVIDMDRDERKGKDGYAIVKKWQQKHGNLPDTWMSLTGRGGYHWFYYDPNTTMGSPRDLFEGVDIRANGAYIVAPPSIHPNGNRYQWEAGFGDETPLAAVNDTVREFLKGEPKPEKTKGFQAPETIPQGERTEKLFKMVSSLQSKGLSDEAIRAAVRAENEAKCIPPLTDKELEQTIFSALPRYEKGTAPYYNQTGGSPNVFEKLAYSISYDREGNEKSKKVIQSIRNVEIVLDNDPRLVGKIAYDEFVCQVYLMGDTPWGYVPNSRAWSSKDDSALFSILQSDYGLKSRNDYFDAVKNVAMRNKFHPVRETLDSLKWDGREHIRRLLPECLGAEDTEYNFEVMKLWMLGAVSRVYSPGCKFDYIIILVGKQGLGKSTFLNLLALNDNWFNDSLDSLDSDKAAQSLMGSWIIELAELKSLARTAGGVDSVKRFLSAKQDKYRIPYERRADNFLRQCVFAGTTNRSDFLQDETGNRRFLVVRTGIHEPTRDIFKPEIMNDI
ncbi:MAG: bifunctional DNA primase/polymerase [Lachnospiraceae bacterium]|nr:bifunctional DNA primase/polymerase [Lachnospiraceae bacterium]